MSFADLHRPGDPFVLPNAWDVGTARALAAAGFPALGTTSLGVAAAHGLPDATRAVRELTLDLARTVARAVGVPVTVDLEDGFSDDPGEVAALVEGLHSDGLAGVNLEDATDGALVDPVRHVAKVRAVKERVPDLFLNVRTDVVWLHAGDLDEAVGRVRAYADAGADGVFVPGALTAEQVAVVTAAVDVPVNVLASPQLTRSVLADLGVARISTGSLLYRSALTRVLEVAAAVRDGGALPDVVSYAEVQHLALEPGQG